MNSTPGKFIQEVSRWFWGCAGRADKLHVKGHNTPQDAHADINKIFCFTPLCRLNAELLWEQLDMTELEIEYMKVTQ